MKTEKSFINRGLISANVFAVIMMGITKLLFEFNILFSGLFVASDFIIIPLVMGIINAYWWRNLNLNTEQQAKYTLYNLLLLLTISFLFMGEGIFCLIIVSPLLFLFLFIGVSIGRMMYKNKRNNKLNVSIISFLFIAFIFDVNLDHHYVRMVSDEIVIRATPDKIWKHVVAFEPIQGKPTFWMFKLGMPMPMQTTVTGYYQGAGRKCIFNDSIIFEETMTVFQPNKDLTFDIVTPPQDPEIIGHIETQRGQFLLKDNHDGTTTLVGNSWYKLNVFPAWYYDLWAESIVRNVHLRVMNHIKLLSEKKR
jgi:hypothetical protein